jgi:hypothetical protein
MLVQTVMIQEDPDDPRGMKYHDRPMGTSKALIVKFEALLDHGHAGGSVTPR